MSLQPPAGALAATIEDLGVRLRGRRVIDVEPPIEPGHAAVIVHVDPATPDDVRAIIVPPAYIECAGRALSALGLVPAGGQS